MELSNKKILLGVSGSIAAYKIPQLVRLLTKQGAQVQVITTPTADVFVSPLVLATLSGKPVLTKMFDENSLQWVNHVHLGREYDLFMIAPLSANTLSKLATGLCDNLLTAVYQSATCPVIVAPAMDDAMWKHPSTQRNIETLKNDGVTVLDVGEGELASGIIGMGRMQEPETIVSFLGNFQISTEPLPLTRKNVVITAGPTQEAIDPVRYISNHSTGKMGMALAQAFATQGAQVQLILGTTCQPTESHPNIKVTKVISANDMLAAVETYAPDADYFIMAAAVADYTPKHPQTSKIKKQANQPDINLQLTQTPDILKTLGAQKKPHQVLVGFALETDNEKQNAINKLQSKNADFVVLNSLKDAGAGFGTDTNKITIFDKNGNEFEFPLAPKKNIANQIVDVVTKKKYV